MKVQHFIFLYRFYQKIFRVVESFVRRSRWRAQMVVGLQANSLLAFTYTKWRLEGVNKC
jgi:hypothetical protein